MRFVSCTILFWPKTFIKIASLFTSILKTANLSKNLLMFMDMAEVDKVLGRNVAE